MMSTANGLETEGLQRSKAKLGLRMSAMRSVKSELSLQCLQKGD
jgi:hypothetical protein